MEIGDYIVRTDETTVTPGKIIDKDGNMLVVQWGEMAFGVVEDGDLDYYTIAHGDPKTGWGNKGK